MTKKALIIGAGPGGLASAILLAAAGVRVKIVERLPIIGGRTSSIEADGFKFDLGPTFFLYPRVLEEIFASAGTRTAIRAGTPRTTSFVSFGTNAVRGSSSSVLYIGFGEGL